MTGICALLHAPSLHLVAVGMTSTQDWEGNQNLSHRLAASPTSIFSSLLTASTGQPTCGEAGIFHQSMVFCAVCPAPITDLPQVPVLKFSDQHPNRGQAENYITLH